MRDFSWSKREKEIARRAFDAAYLRECVAILDMARTMASTAVEPAELWRIHDYLDEQRSATDHKYDYRYSVLILVFARLIREGWLTEEELAGIGEEKLERIRGILEFAL